MGLTIGKVINILKKHRIRYSWEADRHLPLENVGSGVYREVYAVRDLNIVIKFPLAGRGNIAHARQEMKALDRLNHSAPSKLRKHIPKVYWSDWKMGIIVMKRYKQSWTEGRRLARMLVDFFGTSPDYDDFCYSNFGRDGNRLVVLDLGLV